MRIIRILSLVVLVVFVFLLGHFGLLALHRGGTRQPVSRYTADIPAPPGADSPAVLPGGRRAAISYSTPRPVSEVTRFYKRAMPAHGWEKRAEKTGDELGCLKTSLAYSNAAGDSCIISVTAGRAGGARVVVLRATR